MKTPGAVSAVFKKKGVKMTKYEELKAEYDELKAIVEDIMATRKYKEVNESGGGKLLYYDVDELNVALSRLGKHSRALALETSSATRKLYFNKVVKLNYYEDINHAFLQLFADSWNPCVKAYIISDRDLGHSVFLCKFRQQLLSIMRSTNKNNHI